MPVPNQPPTALGGPFRLAVVGECPGMEEEHWVVCPSGHGYSSLKWEYGEKRWIEKCPMCSASKRREAPTPFVGPSGYLLNDCLKRAGVRREQVFVGNVSRVTLSERDFNASRIAGDLDVLATELTAFAPHCVLLLGNQALRAFHPWHWKTLAEEEKEGAIRQLELFSEREVPKRTKRGSKFACKVSDWRGSIFESDVISPGAPKWKCVAAYHPSAILRQRDWMAILRADVKRGVEESRHPALNLPTRRLIVPKTADELVKNLDHLHSLKRLLSFDVEGYPQTGITICSLAYDPGEAWVIPLKHTDLRRWWAPDEENRIIQAFRSLMEDPEVPKTGHNILYEVFMLRWHYGIKLRGIGGDTMLKWHELYSELDKALEVPASLLTRQPYWKFGRGATTDEEMIAYNAVDTCVSLELENAMQPLLTVGQAAHYQFNKRLLEPMSEQMVAGIRFDNEARDALICKRQSEVYELQGELDRLAAIKRVTLSEAAEIVCLKKHLGDVVSWSDVPTYSKELWRGVSGRVAELGALPTLTAAESGELNTLLGRHLNTRSERFTGQLYDHPDMGGWGYPPRYIKEGNKNTDRLSRDTTALLSLIRKYPGDDPLVIALKLSAKLTELGTLKAVIDADGRIRYSANIAGTVTQRHAVKATAMDTGYNLHTVVDDHKHLFLADPGCDLWNIDLSGADGWTIGAECAALGDPTMLEDLRAKVKPAQAVCLLFEKGEVVNTWDRSQIRDASKGIDKNGWLYMAAKKGIWSFCYGAGEQSMISTIADESYAETGTPLYVEVSAIRNLRQCILARYPGVAKRWQRIRMLLDRDGYLECANGSRREFMGDRNTSSSLGEAYAHHPQVMTTYVTSLAWEKLWYDPDNRNGDGSRIAMSLLLVHDSILFQAPIARRAWVKEKVPFWFEVSAPRTNR